MAFFALGRRCQRSCLQGMDEQSAVEHRSSVKRRLSEVRHSARQESRKLNQQLCRQQQQWLKILLYFRVLFLLSDGDTRCLVCGWDALQSRKRDFDISLFIATPIYTYINAEFAAGGVEGDAMVELYAPENAHVIRNWFAAILFFVDWELANHAVQTIVTKGVALQPDFIQAARRKLLLDVCATVPATVVSMVEMHLAQWTPAGARKWLQRWRQSWGFKYGKLQAHALVLSSDLACKARFFLFFWFLLSHHS